MTVLRHALLGATILASSLVLVSPADAQEMAAAGRQMVDFNIPAQDLGAALNELGRQAGVNIAFPVETVAGRTSARLRGKFTPAEAARRLAAGTGLRVTETGRGALVLVRNERSSDATQDDGGTPSGDEIVVTGFREGLATAREVARKADNLVDVLSADDVGKLPDTNIAEALRRLDSVYLIRDQGEGRYVSIRGVDPILNNVTMNGQTIAVSDTDGESGRAAPLDVLSSSALSRVEIHKVTLPYMDGQSIGGTINIVTPSGFDYKNTYLNLSAEAGYNDFGKDNRIWSGNLAFGTKFGANDQFAIFVSGEYWFKQYTSQSYTTSSPVTSPAYGAKYYFPTSVVMAQSIGQKERYGGSANFEYRPDEDTRAWVRYFFTQYNDDRTRPQITLRGLQGRAVAAPAVRRPIVNPTSATEFGYAGYRAQMETRSEVQQRPVQQLVIGGEHRFGERWTLTGDLNYTTAKEINPYQRYFEAITDTQGALPTEAPAITFVLDNRGLAHPTGFNTALSNGLTYTDPAFNTIYRLRGVTSYVREKTYTGNADLKWDGNLGDRDLELRTGFKFILRDKSVDDTDYRYQFTGPKTTLAGFPGLYARFEEGRGESYVPVGGLNLLAPSRDGYEAFFAAHPDYFTYDAVGAASNSIENDYHLKENIYAGYLMGDLHITPSFSLIAGARVEKTDSDISAQGFVASVTSNPGIPAGRSRLKEVPFKTSDIIDLSQSHSYTNVLPAVVARWELAKNWLLRGSVTTNIGRPDYTDLAPISTIVVSESYDAANNVVSLDGSVEIGNPNLEPYKALNFDASLDYYFPDRSGSVTIGGFYKRVDNAVYSIVNDYRDHVFEGVKYDSFVEETVANAGPGYIRGIELSLQKDLVELPAPFNGLGIYANAAFIESDVEIDIPGRANKHVPFFNQADRIYNVQLYYERGGFSARVAYSFQGDATGSSFGANPDLDNYRSPRKTVDAQVSYTFNGFRLSLTGSNLNNQAALNYRNHDRFFVSSYETYGREFRLGISKTW
ncbi:TonB-dependent receptor [Sphingobium nicotianae]|uniref:TonB-dependent receptor n=1 Tax=Sphingobium nicotianae TaxID=2782607 RepID=A0A9X1DEB8_9SPHN|nr:TonB-dependent receptor [Sphingobium nicotianae]MBT2188319.1 TonB-dependent receptor [Sphingobium nicotianae]